MTEHSKVLLLSSSTVYGSGYLNHAEVEIRSFLGHVRRVLFVPFALHDCDAYTARARERFARLGCQVESLHEVPDRGEAIRGAEAMFIGGGNTFRLLKCLYRYDLLAAIRTRVMEGMPYLAASAGSNVAGPTIRTTNDMPIVQPPSFDALGLVPFQINPHYVDADPASTHMGETREERIFQFHEENDAPVLGLREAATLRVAGGVYTIGGTAGARLFRRGVAPVEVEPHSILEL